MNKRKIDINQIKKQSIKGRINTKIAKYQTVFSFFKQKETKDRQIFNIKFPILVRELLQTLNTYELFLKLENKQQLKQLNLNDKDIITLECFQFQGYSNEYPIKQILQCLYIQKYVEEKTKKVTCLIGIIQNKQITFFKKSREIYSQICSNGEKILLESTDYLPFFQNFKTEWIKKQEKGRENNLQKIEKRIVRTLMAFIILIENNILVAIDEKQKKELEKIKLEQYALQIQTKSQKKKPQKMKQLSTYTINSTELISNFSIKQISQKSNEELQLKFEKADYSQKSLNLNTTQNYHKISIFEKADIKNLKLRLQNEQEDNIETFPFINLLSDGIENVLIQEAFNLPLRQQRLEITNFNNQNNYFFMTNPVFLDNQMYGYHNGFIPMNIHPLSVNLGINAFFQQQKIEDHTDYNLHQMRRSVDMFPGFHSNHHNINVNMNNIISETTSVKSRQSQTKNTNTGNKNKNKK